MLFLFFLILPVIQIFVPIAELVIPTGIATIEANVETETHALTAEIKTRKYSKYFEGLDTFSCFSLIKSLCFVSLVSSIFLA